MPNLPQVYEAVLASGLLPKEHLMLKLIQFLLGITVTTVLLRMLVVVVQDLSA